MHDSKQTLWAYWLTGKGGGTTNIQLTDLKELEWMGLVKIAYEPDQAEPTLTELGKTYVIKPQSQGLNL